MYVDKSRTTRIENNITVEALACVWGVYYVGICDNIDSTTFSLYLRNKMERYMIVQPSGSLGAPSCPKSKPGGKGPIISDGGDPNDCIFNIVIIN